MKANHYTLNESHPYILDPFLKEAWSTVSHEQSILVKVVDMQ